MEHVEDRHRSGTWVRAMAPRRLACHIVAVASGSLAVRPAS